MFHFSGIQKWGPHPKWGPQAEVPGTSDSEIGLQDDTPDIAVKLCIQDILSVVSLLCCPPDWPPGGIHAPWTSLNVLLASYLLGHYI